MSLLTLIDIFGKDFKFFIGGTIKFNTSFGGVMSILVAIGTTIMTAYFGLDMYYKELPIFLQEIKFADEAPIYNVNASNFVYAVRLEDAKGNIIDDRRFFEYSFRLNHYILNGSIMSLVDSSTFPLERCSTKHIDNDTLINQRLNLFMCSNYSGPFGGNWLLSDFYEIVYVLERCNSRVEQQYNIKCASSDELKTTFPYVYFGHTIFNNALELKNYQNPIKKIYTYSYSAVNIHINNSLVNYWFLHYSMDRLTTDSGIIFEDNQSRDYLAYSKITYNYGPCTEDNSPETIGTITILSNVQSLNILRSYKKLPGVLASVGGIISIAIPAITMIFDLYLENKFHMFLFDSMFKFEADVESFGNQELRAVEDQNYENSFLSITNISRKKNKEIDSKDQDLSNSKQLMKKRKSKLLCSITDKKLSKLVNKDINDLFKFKDTRRKSCQISSSDRFCLKNCLCCTKRANRELKVNYELILAANHQIQHKFEILEFVKMIDQFRLMKKMFFNKNQNFMLDNREKQLIVNKLKKTDEIVDLELQKINEKKQNLVNYIKSKITTRMDDIDSLLFKYLDLSLKDQIKTKLKNEKD